MKIIFYLTFILITVISCGGLDEANKVLRNEKVKTTDEFLVKKRDPLIMPPNYNEIPSPDTILKKKKNDKDKLKNILKVPESENGSDKSSLSIENSILNKIKR